MDLSSISSMPVAVPEADLTHLSAQSRSRDPRAIDAVAKGLEGLFVTMMLKQMRQTLEPGAMFGNDPGDVLGGIFDNAMGEHLGQSEALGIAAMVRKQLESLGNNQSHAVNDQSRARQEAGRLVAGRVPAS
ncbi:MAG: rod-binding protein [Planctomycetes bacterium]|nr:rod-binding protein [Planctomycetota bacterium]